jgi:hypothetical protein
MINWMMIPSSLLKIRLGWKGLQKENALAYYNISSVMAKEEFYNIGSSLAA